MRDAAGQRFAKAHRVGTDAHERYHLLTGRAEKEQYRTDWAKQTFAHFVEGKQEVTKYSDIDQNIGTYLTEGAIIQALGGHEWPDAVTGAKKYVTKCKLMKGKWVSECLMSDLPMFLHVKREFHQVFAQSWQAFKKEHSSNARISE